MIALQQIGEMLRPIFEKQGIERAVVFGSCARGDATPASDIDLLIDSGGRLGGIRFFVVGCEIAEALPMASDVYEQREIKDGSVLHNAIAAEGVVIYDRQRRR